MTSRLHGASLLRAHDVQFYRICEDVTETLIYLMVVFSPWAFGTTQSWSIWTMNGAGYCLGALSPTQWATPGAGSRTGSRRGGRNVDAMATAPRPIPNEPMYSQK